MSAGVDIFSWAPPIKNVVLWLTLTHDMQQKGHAASLELSLKKYQRLLLLCSSKPWVICIKSACPAGGTTWRNILERCGKRGALKLHREERQKLSHPNTSAEHRLSVIFKILEVWVKLSWTFWQQLPTDCSFIRPQRKSVCVWWWQGVGGHSAKPLSTHWCINNSKTVVIEKVI